MCEHTPHEDPLPFIHPIPAQLVFGHVTLLNDEEAFLQGLECGMQFSSEWYHEPQQLSAHVVFTNLLDTLAIKRIPRAWRLGFCIGEVIGLLHPDLEPQDPAHSYLEALAQRLAQSAG